MVKGEIGYLIGTGFALGVVHVLTGPDHLSALATLSANVGNHLDGFLLGVRWGVGHSSGLLVVGTVLILLSDQGQDRVDMPDYALHLFESIVGIFMILLGCWGFRRALLKRPMNYYNAIGYDESPMRDESDHFDDEQQGVGQNENTSETDRGDENCHSNTHDEIHSYNKNDDNSSSKSDNSHNQNLEIYFEGDESPVCVPPVFGGGDEHVIVAIGSDESDLEGAVVVEQAYLDTVSPSRCRRFFNNITRRISTKTLAFLIGIVHGLAGPGGVLGVIPAVQLQNWKLATLYLGCFCISSTLTMGCFATMYGNISSKLVGDGADIRREFQIECFSACLSIFVGITWLTLLSLGKLEDVFP